MMTTAFETQNRQDQRGDRRIPQTTQSKRHTEWVESLADVKGPYVVVEHPIEDTHQHVRSYRSPTEDAAIGKVMREWKREKERVDRQEAYQARKSAWEEAHPGKAYEDRPRNHDHNITVWHEGMD